MRFAGAAGFELVREDLMRWYYIEGLRGVALRDRYLGTHGVLADERNLQRWVEQRANKPAKLETEVSFHAHACGEYVLARLQEGCSARDVAKAIHWEFLVEATPQGLVRYRRYRERIGPQVTEEQLTCFHWRSLYGLLVELDVGPQLDTRQDYMGADGFMQALDRLHPRVCADLQLLEHLVSRPALGAFVKRHFRYVQLGADFPAAQRHVNTVSPCVLALYRGTFAGEELGWSASACVLSRDVLSRCRAVAAQGHLVWPRASAEAATVMAYASLKCEELYRAEVCWHSSLLSPVQRELLMEPPRIDFFFWLAYGAWSHCPCCGVYHFQDEYFRNQVYRQVTSSTSPALIAGSEFLVPSFPVEHGPENVGISSRWWYRPQMYQTSRRCSFCPESADG